MKTTTKPKYAMFQEAFEFLRAEKVVIGIQFAIREPVVEYARKRRSQLHGHPESSVSLSVVRGRVAFPNILFFALAPIDKVSLVDQALRNLAKTSPTYRISRRVTIID